LNGKIDKGEFMTLDEILRQVEGDTCEFAQGMDIQEAKQAILSWFKEQLPKEKAYEYGDIQNGCYWTHASKSEYCACCEGIAIGRNQTIKDILTNLTAKQGER